MLGYIPQRAASKNPELGLTECVLDASDFGRCLYLAQ